VAVPEPGTWALVGVAVAGWGAVRRWRRRQRQAGEAAEAGDGE
jgi:hypothetical protein